MHLVRFATLYLSPRPKSPSDRVFDIEDYNVQLHVLEGAASGPSRSFLISATTKIDTPELDGANRIVIPSGPRKGAEHAIEIAADTISLFSGSRGRLSSPMPCVALGLETDVERQFVESSAGILAARTLRSDIAVDIPIDDETLGGIADRIDGVRLLAEALSHAHAAGQFRDLIRFFELAFGLPYNKLNKKLMQFLAGSSAEYRRDEIDQWLAYRDPVSHADMTKTPFVAFGSDVASFIPRMKQAGYDVLLNKKDWHSSSRLRRSLWRPSSWVGPVGYHLTQGEAVNTHPQCRTSTPDTRRDNRMTTLQFSVNGTEHVIDVPESRTLAQVLRLDLGLTGTKIGCEEAECGICTVLVDDVPVDSCLYPAFKAQGTKVTTIEGLAEGEDTASIAAQLH